jgi:hypothetical protein
MTTMFDALLAAIPDGAYFNQTDFGTKLKDQLLVSDIPFGCYLKGAALWDLERHPVYPIYSMCKTNTEDNVKFAPYKTGSAVLSSERSGELLVFFMKSDAGKTPSIKPRPPSAPSSIPDAKSYSTRDIWRKLSVEDLCGGHGKYSTYLHAGSFQSQPYQFEAVNTKIQNKETPFETILKSKEPFEKNPFGIANATVMPSSELPLPNEIGVKWAAEKSSGKNNGRPHFPIHGSFRFEGDWPKEYERLPIHFLVALEGVNELDVNTLWIPRSKCSFRNGGYSGTFKFDLADLFIAPGDGKSKPPKEAWISVVHRKWLGPIVKDRFDLSP